MFVYLARRFLLLIPTLFGITLITFVLINLAPGGPVEQKIQQMRMGGDGGGGRSMGVVNQQVLDALKKQYGFDKPLHMRYLIWLKNIVHMDFGDSFVYEEPVVDVIKSKFPVSLQFGIVSLILTYSVCIPLGIRKAIKVGSRFDQVSTVILNATYAIPTLVMGIYLITVFSGKLNWFPVGNLYSDDYEGLTTGGKIWDRVHHFVLPTICYMMGGFTELTVLMKNSMLDVIKTDYVRTARAKGLDEKIIQYKHALRNALIPIATGIGGFLGVFLTGSILIETVFNLDGIGLLSYKSVLQRDYNVIMGLTFLSSVALMFGRILSDVIYVLVDPRIDFK